MKILPLTVFIIAIVLGAIIVSSATIYDDNETIEDLTDEDFQEMINTIYQDVSSYIHIDNVMGKYHQEPEARRVKQIALQIHPQFSTEITLSDLIIQISNGQQIVFLSANETGAQISDETLFNHPLWANLNNNSFGYLIMFDEDDSIGQYQLINHHSDRVFIIFKLPSLMNLQKGDRLSINLYPSSGVTKKLDLRIPFSIDSIFSFW